MTKIKTKTTMSMLTSLMDSHLLTALEPYSKYVVRSHHFLQHTPILLYFVLYALEQVISATYSIHF